jgi:spore coat protein U-like protein
MLAFGALSAAPTPAAPADSCTVSVAPVVFGAVSVLSGAASDTNGGPLTVRCVGTSGTVSYTVALDNGSGAGATTSLRWLRLVGGQGQLGYSLYRTAADRASGAAWGDLGGAVLSGSLTVSNNAGSLSHTIYGRIFGSQRSASPGPYADTVTITVSY